ncbi:aspartate/glutamate racemase family protein [Sphingomonas sp.]|uniref:aspartate/glutamate racemase family protein n=1 Tax=Sphingomonas sp. TaxID=28214 RepID=UPI002DB70635|nr:aspartate/glutamate racemase family protein [Sphingomonas sp.]HEU4970213.1 aspartate/glutamate racemase family protein [Sphingomonas sp.]
MTRRIALIGGGAAAGPVVAPELRQLVGSEDELVAYPSRVSVFPHTALELLLQEVGHAEAAVAAVDDGVAAIAIDSVGDYGLAAMRASLPVPAFGAGEAGMAAAGAEGRRFTIVTVWPPSMNFILEGRLRAYGHSGACAGIFNIGTEPDVSGPEGPGAYLSRIKSGHRSVIDKAAGAIATAAAQGAEAVMLGCTCMSGIAATLAAQASVPVINPLAAAVAAAAKAEAVPPPETLADRKDMLRAMVDAIPQQPAEACPVCIEAPQP